MGLAKKCRLFVCIAVSLAACYSAAGEAADLDHNHAELHAAHGISSSTLFPGYASLCDLSLVFRNVNLPRKAQAARAQSSNQTSRANRKRESDSGLAPMQVFDNLYFLGTQGVSAWLYGTEDGYILIDALTTDEEAERVIEGGMKALGLDPAKISYLLVTHAHGDHYGGHRFWKEKYNLPVVMSEADWELAGRLGEHPRFGPPPVKDELARVVQHGDTLTAGQTSLDIHVTPSHTLGTISPLFTVYDNGKPHRAALWGGTGYNFGVKPEQFEAYALSARTYKKNAKAENLQVFLSNHGKRDGSIERMKALANRQPGDPHPFVMDENVLQVFDVLEQCALAQYDRIESGDYQQQVD